MKMGKKLGKFRAQKRLAHCAGLFCMVPFLYYRKKYGLTVETYFEERLYNLRENHDDYLSKFDKYTRTWGYVVRNDAVKFPESRYFFYRIDYWFAKLIYPGLDARDYFSYEFYNFTHQKRKTFVTEGGLAKMVEAFNGKGDASILADKAKFNRYFSRFIYRKWIATENMTEESFSTFCQGLTKAIVKPLAGAHGRDIYIAEIEAEEQRTRLCTELRGKRYIVEELVQQHSTTAALNPASVNTIRVYSVWKKDTAYITSAFIRVGGGNAPVDNYHSGGCAAAIDIASGIINAVPVNRRGERILKHPVSGQIILGLEIPCWDEVLRTVREAHAMLPELRYIAWDVVVMNDGRITFIEGNQFGGVDAQQQPTLTGMREVYDKLL